MGNCPGPRLTTEWQTQKIDVNNAAKVLKTGMYVENTNHRRLVRTWGLKQLG